MAGLTTSPDELLLAAAESATPEYTGRQIITFKEGALDEGVRQLESAETPIARSSDFSDDTMEYDTGNAGMLVFDELNVAVADANSPMSMMAMDAGGDSPIAAVEPETFVFAIATDVADEIDPDELEADAEATAAATWGLIVTKVLSSTYTGRGIKVAILDTGFDFRHPDFAGRPIIHRSFISGQTSQDVHGHGTHCTGTACGPRTSPGNPRFGIAYESRIHIGKVLSNSGSGTTAGILAGMNWAVANRCEVISMSLGGGGGPYTYYTQAGQQALNAGCLIVAATGNNSSRPGVIAPVLAPANSPTITAVAAIDDRLRLAAFSCGGPPVDIAAPGVGVFSTLPLPRKYASWSGTSMATPHVAGIAALLAQSNPGLRGNALRNAVLQAVRALPFPPTDVGRGLAQAR